MDKGERIRVNNMSTIRIGDQVIAQVYRPFNGGKAHIHGEIVDIKYPVFRVKYMGCRFIDFLFEDVDRTVFVGEDRIERFETRFKNLVIDQGKPKDEVEQKLYFILASGNGKSRQSLKTLIEHFKSGSIIEVTDDEMFRRAWRLNEELNKTFAPRYCPNCGRKLR